MEQAVAGNVNTASNKSLVDVQRAAYERLLPEIQAVPESECLPINVDLPFAVSLALGAVPKLRELRAQIGQLPFVKVEWIDKLEDYAYAAAYAHASHEVSSVGSEQLPVLQEEGLKLRELLLSSAQNLAKYGLVDGAALSGLKPPSGYRGLSVNLTALAKFFRDEWADVIGKTPVTLEDLERASVLGGLLLKATGEREAAPVVVGERALIKRQAFTLFARAYKEARRCVGFLREDELDLITPSLYIGRNNGGRKSEPEAVVTPAPAPTTPAGAAPVEPTKLPIGHPDSSPFIS
jgi:hypothetical protein